MKKPVLVILISGVVVFVLIFIVSMITIYSGVYQACKDAKSYYKSNDCVASLMLQVSSTNHTFKEKNTAVWALGQIADKRALPLLKSMYEGVPSHKEPLDKAVSQHELEKAIKWCQKGNVTSWMYKKL